MDLNSGALLLHKDIFSNLSIILVHAENKDRNMTLSSSITEKFCVGYLPPGSIVFIDKYFNSLPLLESFSEKRLKCIGTIRNDLIERAPLKDLKKETRGSMYGLQDEENSITLIRAWQYWHDNSQMTIATNVQEMQ